MPSPQDLLDRRESHAFTSGPPGTGPATTTASPEPREEVQSMAIRIKARNGESVEQLMRRFKKLCEKEGLTKDIKRKEFFEKPSERKRRAQRKSVARRGRE